MELFSKSAQAVPGFANSIRACKILSLPSRQIAFIAFCHKKLIYSNTGFAKAHLQPGKRVWSSGCGYEFGGTGRICPLAGGGCEGAGGGSLAPRGAGGGISAATGWCSTLSSPVFKSQVFDSFSGPNLAQSPVIWGALEAAETSPSFP